jgi:hypothetical protein
MTLPAPPALVIAPFGHVGRLSMPWSDVRLSYIRILGRDSEEKEGSRRKAGSGGCWRGSPTSQVEGRKGLPSFPRPSISPPLQSSLPTDREDATRGGSGSSEAAANNDVAAHAHRLHSSRPRHWSVPLLALVIPLCTAPADLVRPRTPSWLQADGLHSAAPLAQ